MGLMKNLNDPETHLYLAGIERKVTKQMILHDEETHVSKLQMDNFSKFQFKSNRF